MARTSYCTGGVVEYGGEMRQKVLVFVAAAVTAAGLTWLSARDPVEVADDCASLRTAVHASFSLDYDYVEAKARRMFAETGDEDCAFVVGYVARR